METEKEQPKVLHARPPTPSTGAIPKRREEGKKSLRPRPNPPPPRSDSHIVHRLPTSVVGEPFTKEQHDEMIRQVLANAERDGWTRHPPSGGQMAVFNYSHKNIFI